jgi:hypothetical protein
VFRVPLFKDIDPICLFACKLTKPLALILKDEVIAPVLTDVKLILAAEDTL